MCSECVYESSGQTLANPEFMAGHTLGLGLGLGHDEWPFFGLFGSKVSVKVSLGHPKCPLVPKVSLALLTMTYVPGPQNSPDKP